MRINLAVKFNFRKNNDTKKYHYNSITDKNNKINFTAKNISDSTDSFIKNTTFQHKEKALFLLSQVFKSDRLALCEQYAKDSALITDVKKSELFKKYAQNKEGYNYTPEDFKTNVNDDMYKLNQKNLQFAFSLIQDFLSSADNNAYNNMFALLGGLSESIYSDNKEKTNLYWSKINKQLKEYFFNTSLPKAKQKREEKQIILDNFLDSSFAKRSNNLNLIDQIFNSVEYSLDEKNFLIAKLTQPHGYDLCNFLISQPPNNAIRKQIIGNIQDAETFADENYSELKQVFTQDLKARRVESPILNKEILGVSLIDLIIKRTDTEYDSNFMDFEEKVDYLAQLSDEVISNLLETQRQDWILDHSIEAFDIESMKYDMNSRFDDIISKITANVNGKEATIAQIATDIQKIVYLDDKKLDVFRNETAKNFAQNKQIHDEQNKALSHNLDAICKLLVANTLEARQFQAAILKELDKIEQKFPQKKKEVKEARSVLQKISDGLLNLNNFPSYAFAYGSLSKIGSTLTKTGNPTAATFGLILMGMAHLIRPLSSVINEFKKG